MPPEYLLQIQMIYWMKFAWFVTLLEIKCYDNVDDTYVTLLMTNYCDIVMDALLWHYIGISERTMLWMHCFDIT